MRKPLWPFPRHFHILFRHNWKTRERVLTKNCTHIANITLSAKWGGILVEAYSIFVIKCFFKVLSILITFQGLEKAQFPNFLFFSCCHDNGKANFSSNLFGKQVNSFPVLTKGGLSSLSQVTTCRHRGTEYDPDGLKINHSSRQQRHPGRL